VSTSGRGIRRCSVCNERQRVLQDFGNVAFEYFGDVMEFIRDLELVLPSVIDRDCAK